MKCSPLKANVVGPSISAPSLSSSLSLRYKRDSIMRSVNVSLALLVVLIGSRQTKADSVVINEFMANNESTLADEDGDYHDWIELFNSSQSPVDLDGWHLTDDRGELRKWTFPSVTLETGRYLVLFASGKDRSDPLGEMHTNFRLSTHGEYLGLIRPDGITVAHEFLPAYPPQQPDVPFTYGLSPDGVAGTNTVFLAPTPRMQNAPEPSTLVLLGVGVLGLAARVRRWRRVDC